jgi:hypothetical protein
MLLWKTALAAIFLAPTFAADNTAPAQDFVAHEWGTFTSVAGKDGTPVAWAPLSGAADLPCFVDRLSPLNIKLAQGLVRMETPVLYFYPELKMTLSVQVDFPRGWLTEWYPQATQVKPDFSRSPGEWARFGNGRLEWDTVQAQPVENPEFPTSVGPSRYYAARNTDSALLHIGGQQEKFIFYRGMANFLTPLEPVFRSDGKLTIHNSGSDTIPLAILFENHSGKIGYRVAHGLDHAVTLDPPELTGNLPALRQDIVNSLVEFGLYQKEALAMLETWQDSWFEEGTRVFYIVPRPFVDGQLPLKITPAPTTLARVFVGRVETLSPWMQQTIETALAKGDVPALTKFGRFLDPFLLQIQAADGHIAEASAAQTYLQEARVRIWQEFNAASCVK